MSWWIRWLSSGNSDHAIGRAGERAAAKYLKSKHYKILSRNLRSRVGEIDILALDPDNQTIVLVEVKSGRESSSSIPEHRVTPAKQRKLVSLAADLAKRQQLTSARFRWDVIGVELNSKLKVIEIRHVPGAFESNY